MQPFHSIIVITHFKKNLHFHNISIRPLKNERFSAIRLEFKQKNHKSFSKQKLRVTLCDL